MSKEIDDILNKVNENSKKEKKTKYDNMSVDDLLSSISESRKKSEIQSVSDTVTELPEIMSEQAEEITPDISSVTEDETSAADEMIESIRKNAAEAISEIEKTSVETEPEDKNEKASEIITEEIVSLPEEEKKEIKDDKKEEKKVNTAEKAEKKPSFFKRLLDENPDELIKTPKESPEKNPAENAEKLRKKNKSYTFLGVIITLFACLGIAVSVLKGIEYVGNFTSGRTRMRGFEKVVYPAVIMDISSFQSPSELSSDQIITAAIWSMVMSDSTLDNYQNAFDVVTVPAVDVEAYAVKVFGEELPELVHTTVGPAEARFYYNEETKSYNIPVKPVVFTYTPKIVSVDKTDDVYTVVVDYEDELPAWIESKISKTAKYKIKETDGNYIISSMEMIYSPNTL